MRSRLRHQPALLIFAKQPRAGETKTRLQPDYTPQQAAKIAAFMLRATVELAVASWPGEVSLYGAPDADHPLFSDLADEFGVRLARQHGHNLGERMHHAFADVLTRRNAVAIFGCDVPHCSWAVLDQANGWLAKGRNVLGPTEDGGYYFIGLTAPHAGLFDGIDWGTDQVLAQTLERAKQLDVEFEWLPRLRDVDTADDLKRVSQEYAPLRTFVK
ncbi:MAG: TIGR04282 family arsenosugar biosynthesis glycosyltransferase [Gammaproteobacteria bacterium]|nr:TIGR04282 family arsenosugar biosynthesis glycosyltransferase [Gammaproteobacteria bacterium]